MVNSKSSGLLTLQHKDIDNSSHKEIKPPSKGNKIDEEEYDFVLK